MKLQRSLPTLSAQPGEVPLLGQNQDLRHASPRLRFSLLAEMSICALPTLVARRVVQAVQAHGIHLAGPSGLQLSTHTHSKVNYASLV